MNNNESAKILLIFAEFLPDKPINEDSNFFELGGDSLSAALALIKVEEQFGVKVSHECFYRSPTVRAVAIIVSDVTANISA
jgi:acyl carrier protein